MQATEAVAAKDVTCSAAACVCGMDLRSKLLAGLGRSFMDAISSR